MSNTSETQTSSLKEVNKFDLRYPESNSLETYPRENIAYAFPLKASG